MYTSVRAQSQKHGANGTKVNVRSTGNNLLTFIISQMQSNIDGSLSCINIIIDTPKGTFATGKIINLFVSNWVFTKITLKSLVYLHI